MLAVVDGLHGFGQTVAPQAVRSASTNARRWASPWWRSERRAHRPRRRLGGDGRGGGLRLRAFRQRLRQRAGGAVRRHRAPAFHRAVLRRRAAARVSTPIVLDFATSMVAEGKVLVASQGGKKLPDNALITLDGQMSADPHVLYGDYTATGLRDHRQGQGRNPRLRRTQGLGSRADVRTARRLAHRHERHRRGPAACGNGMLSFYVNPEVIDPEASSPRTSPATSPTTRAPSRSRPAARC